MNNYNSYKLFVNDKLYYYLIGSKGSLKKTMNTKNKFIDFDEIKLTTEILTMSKKDIEKNLKRAKRYQKILKYVVGNSSFALKKVEDKNYKKIVDMNHLIEKLITMLSNRLVTLERNK